MSWMPPPASQQRAVAPVPLQAPFHGPLQHNTATQLASGVVTSHTSPPVYPLEGPGNSANIDGGGGGGGVAVANTANGPTNTLLSRGGRGGVDTTTTTTSTGPSQMFVDQQQQQQQLASPPQPPPAQFTNQQYKPHLASPSNWQQQNIPTQQQQQQPQNVTSKMMPPTVAATNNWQQQQQQQPANYFHQQQQQPQQPVQLSNQQPQQQPVMGVNSWQQTEQIPPQMPPANVYGQQPPQHRQEPPAAPMYQQQQQPHPPTQGMQNSSNYFGQQQQPSHEYFTDNTNNNNSGGTNGGTNNDGWCDWDWNDNGNDFQQQQQQQHPSTQQQHTVPQQHQSQHHLQQQPPTQQHQQPPPQQQTQLQQPPPQQHQQPPPQQHQQPPPQLHQQPPPTQQQQLQPQQPVEPNANFQPPHFHPNVIEDSFSTSSNDNWQWNMSDTAPPATAGANVGDATLSGGQKELLPPSFPAPESTNEQFPGPTAGDSNATSPQAASTGVFVSQAKPVPHPPRQYASLAAETVSAAENAVTPPQAFQNERVAEQQLATPPAAPPTTVAGIVPPPPAKAETVAMPPAAAPPAMIPVGAAPPAVAPPAVAPPAMNPTGAAPPALNPAGPTPLPPMGGPRGANPFKRAGAAQHHRAAGLLGPNPNTLPPPLAVAESPATTLQAAANAFAMPPPPPADFANPIMPNSTEDFPEHQEVVAAAPAAPSISLPNADRNQYLQTSHLSENPDYAGVNLDGDSALPPPGLSRLVLGQPELAEAAIRMVTGTDEPSAGSNLDIEERHADGEDTSGEQAMMMPPQPDRNRYLVPGESQASNEQRVVTGVETTNPGQANVQPPTGAAAAPQIISEQREIVLDGENLEDLEQQQQQQQHHSLSRNEPPLEGAVSSTAAAPVPVDVEAMPPGDSNMVQSAYSAKSKDTLSLTNASTGNDESDPLLEEDFDEAEERHHRGHGRYNAKTRGGGGKYEAAAAERSKLEKGRKDKQRSVERSSEETADEEDDYHLSMRERERRRHREGSVRSDREERDYKDAHRQRRDAKREAAGAASRDKYGGYASGNKGERSQRSQRYSSRYENGAADSSKYETEESARHESGRGKEPMRRSMRGGPQAAGGAGGEDRRSDRSDRDYDEYKRWYRGSKRGEDRERRERYAGESAEHEARRREGGRHYRRDRDDYDTAERRRRSDKHRAGGEVAAAAASAREYEEYRKQSSRNARESDLEKEGGRSARGGDPRYDPRLHGNAGSAAMMYGAYPGYAYDPSYAAYYYEQMARTNPQAYSEWYKKYYGHGATVAAPSSAAALASAQSHHAAGGAMDHMSLTRDDGRESVHSGRSSIAAMHSDKDRYTQAYISQANEYHHQHHHQQQQQLQQQQHRYPYPNNQNYNNQLHQMAYQNVSLNGTQRLLDDGDAGSVVGGDRMSSARSIGNLSQSGGGGGGGAGGFYGSSASISMMGVDHHYHHQLQQHHHHHQQQQQHQLHQQQQQQQYHQRHSQHHQYYARSEYADSRSGNLSMRDPEPDPQRLTPCKFINEHTVVSIGGGVLVTVKPKYTPHGSISNVVRLQRICANDGMRHLFQTYPGPLVRGLTHKKTIIEFCEEQIRLGPMQTTIFAKQLLPSNVDKYKASYTLMWNLLILLLRQNGMVVGTDIAELLLKNQQQFPYQAANLLTASAASPQQPAKTIGPASDGSEADYDKLSDEAAAPEDPRAEEEEADETSEAKHANETDEKRTNELAGESPGVPAATLSEEEITEKFRNYLLYGNVNEALEWATDNNLWGHALFLASKVDRRSHANVMMKFANKLSLNDPLQTLYQLMSGRTPSSVTSVQDEKWGDWRPHLSMILSNTSQKPELDRKAITTLGDSLFNRGDLFAAHFCYLMAQVGFGRYQESATGETTLQQSLPKLVLLGSSHYKSLRDFATNESIMMTEIYEYACSLNDEKFSLVEFQPYKFLLATRMADYGFHLKSLMYMEQIAVHIERDSGKYEASFIQKVYDLADRLKFYDPVLEKTLDDQQQVPDGLGGGSQQFEEQKWLQNLRNTVSQYQHSAGLYESQQSAAQYQQQQIDQQFVEINKQFNELNLQYANDAHLAQPAAPPTAVEPQFYNPEGMAVGQAVAEPPQPAQPVGDFMQQPQTQAAEVPAEQGQDPYGSYAQQQAAHQQQQLQQQQQQQQQQQLQQQQQQQYMQPEPQNAFYDPQQQQQQQYNSMDPNASYDYYGSQQQQPQMQQQQPSYGDEPNAPRPTISMPKSKTYDSDEDAGKSRKQQQQQKGGAPPLGGKGGEQRGNKDNKEKNSQAANQNSGWFGGIWNKLSLKPKNQMILPDDKNPTIVWDPEKKRWVNTGDGDDAAEEALKPPPKMSDIVSQAQQQQQQQQQFPPPQQQHQQQQQPLQQQQYGQPQMPPMEATPAYGQLPGGPVAMASGYPPGAASPGPAPAVPAANEQAMPVAAAAPGGAAKPPSLQSNMFKMQRNRTLKNSYVDVFNPSGAPMSSAADNVMAPAVPPAAVPSGGFFIPGAPPAGQEQQQQGGGYQQQQDVPQFYNPNQYGNPAASGGY